VSQQDPSQAPQDPPLYQPWDSRRNAPEGAAAAPPPRTDPADDPALRLLVPVGRSGWAIAAGYLGLFSVLGIFAPFALLAGILALQDIAANPRKHGKGRAIFGIIMGTLGTALLLFAVYMMVTNKKGSP
jgi:hypothetical protein